MITPGLGFFKKLILKLLSISIPLQKTTFSDFNTPIDVWIFENESLLSIIFSNLQGYKTDPPLFLIASIIFDMASFGSIAPSASEKTIFSLPLKSIYGSNSSAFLYPIIEVGVYLG